MQRNWDIIRKIMIEVERLPTEVSVFCSNEVSPGLTAGSGLKLCELARGDVSVKQAMLVITALNL
jgi:hypothetical protein